MGSLTAPFWGGKAIIWIQNSDFLAPKKYSYLIQYLFGEADKTCGCPPKAGSGRNQTRCFWCLKVSSWIFIGWAQRRPEQDSFPLCVSMESHGKTLPLPVPDSIPCCWFSICLCIAFPRLRPYLTGCVHFYPCISMTGKFHVTAAHGYNSKVSNVTVNFMALFLLENLVRMQLLYNS